MSPLGTVLVSVSYTATLPAVFHELVLATLASLRIVTKGVTHDLLSFTESHDFWLKTVPSKEDAPQPN